MAVQRIGLSDEMAQCVDTCIEAAQICEWCADECEQHDHDHCQACAEILPRCAESCRNMAST